MAADFPAEALPTTHYNRGTLQREWDSWSVGCGDDFAMLGPHSLQFLLATFAGWTNRVRAQVALQHVDVGDGLLRFDPPQNLVADDAS
tara:strand:- start:2865 stop:3128 length:264 start_codon:yes stop_codon:yes gene_type:complete